MSPPEDVKEELTRSGEEPLLPVEKQLIAGSLLLGLLLLGVLMWISYKWFPVQ